MVTGIGGVFQRAKDAQRLRDWYARHLGFSIEDWGGHVFEWAPPGSTTWAIFDADSDYFGRRDQQYMLNFRVTNLDTALARLRADGVEILEKIEDSEFGRFGWAHDCEGNRFELWQPPPGQ